MAVAEVVAIVEEIFPWSGLRREIKEAPRNTRSVDVSPFPSWG
jgi:hypothetical protein